MLKKQLVFTFFAICITCSLSDKVDCFRLTDSRYGHYVNCSSTKPLPLKTQTTFQLDKDFQWTSMSYSVELMDGETQQKTSLNGKCLQGVPSVGNKTAGTYLTLGMTCYSLPRELKAGDMIHYTIIFPNMEWLTYGIPIPGYSTYEDIKRVMISSQIQSKKFLTNKQSDGNENIRPVKE